MTSNYVNISIKVMALEMLEKMSTLFCAILVLVS